MGEGDDDPDREAILARRRKFIAVALAGLTSAAGCGDDAAPEACLNMMHPNDPGAHMEPIEDDTAAEPEPEPESTTPPDEQGDETGEGEAETGDQTTTSQQGSSGPKPDMSRPRVCLRRAAPRPPRKQGPEPMPCLLIMEKPGGLDDEDA